MQSPVRAVVGFSAKGWVASARNIDGCSARGPTREACLASLLDQLRDSVGADVAVLVEEDPPALVGVSEAASILGWDRRKVAVYAARGHFPPPVVELAGGRLWRRADIKALREEGRGRVPQASGGRPVEGPALSDES